MADIRASNARALMWKREVGTGKPVTEKPKGGERGAVAAKAEPKADSTVT
jgi:hypothetical protein